MLSLGFINNATRTLGDALGAQQRPLVLMAAKYWWVSVPVAIAIWSAIKERRANGGIKTHLLVTDIGMIITPAISLILLAEFVNAQQSGQPAATPAAAGAAGLGSNREHGHAGILSPSHKPMKMPNGAVPIPEAADNPMQSILGGY